MLIKYGLLGG